MNIGRSWSLARGFVTATVARLGSQACPPPFPPAIIRHAVRLYMRFTLS